MIIGNDIRFRAFERADLPALRRAAQWSTASPPAPPDADAPWLESVAAKSRRLFAVEDKSGALLGTAAYEDFDWKNRSVACRTALYAGGRKEFESTLRLLAKFAFDELNLHRVSLRVLKENASARAACLRAGFREEGTARAAVRHGAVFADAVLLARVRKRRQEKNQKALKIKQEEECNDKIRHHFFRRGEHIDPSSSVV